MSPPRSANLLSCLYVLYVLFIVGLKGQNKNLLEHHRRRHCCLFRRLYIEYPCLFHFTADGTLQLCCFRVMICVLFESTVHKDPFVTLVPSPTKMSQTEILSSGVFFFFPPPLSSIQFNSILISFHNTNTNAKKKINKYKFLTVFHAIYKFFISFHNTNTNAKKTTNKYK